MGNPIYCVSVSVYDTTQPSVEIDAFNYAERKTCTLTYDGADDKLQTLIPSRLDFSLEVGHDESDTDLFYQDLFTGDEKKYKVVIADQDENVLWEGFLLPDEYSEPYTVGTFYPKFVAIDNLGALKGYNFDDVYYQSRHSVSKIIADCLKETGLEYQIWIAPSIENIGPAKGRYDQLYLNATQWMGDDGDKTSCYDILESILLGFGCSLWQEKGVWKIVGYQSKGVAGQSFYVYDKDGVYVKTQTGDPNVDVVYLDWNATPIVSLLPPYKEVVVNSGVERNNELLRDDIANQEWVKTAEPQTAPSPKYWVVNDDVLDIKLYTNTSGSDIPEYIDTPLDIDGFVGFTAVAALTEPAVYDYYLELKNPIFLRGKFKKINLTGTIVYNRYNNNEVPIYYELNDKLFYEVSAGSDTIISNREDFTARTNFFYEFTEIIRDGRSYLSCKIDVELKDFTIDDFINFRIYNPLNATAFGDVIWVEDLQIETESYESARFSKRRELSRSNTLPIDLSFGDSAQSNVEPTIIYQPLYDAADFTEIPFSTFVDYSAGGVKYGTVYSFTLENYNIFLANLYKIFLLRETSDFYEYVRDFTLIGLVSGNYLVQVNLVGPTTAWTFAKLYYHDTIFQDPQTKTSHQYRERWRKRNIAGQDDRFCEVLAKISHDVNALPHPVFEGVTSGLVFPGDYVYFNFKGETKQWVPMRLKLAFGENETDVTVSEYINELVTDYEL